MTDEHAEGIDFSIPYYVTSERLVVRRKGKQFTTLADLEGHKVGTIKDTQAERMLTNNTKISLSTYDEETDAFMDLVNGRTDAILIDGPIAKYYGDTNPDLHIVGEPIGRVQYGIAFAKGQNTELRERVNAALQVMQQDGSLHHILTRWDLWTPEMAQLTNDHTQPNVTPAAWNNYVAELQGKGGLRVKLERYAGFVPQLVRAAGLTLLVSLCAMVVAVALGLGLALLRLYGPRPLAWLAATYVEIVRGTPLLIQVLFIFYGLPEFGISMSPFVAGVVSLGLNYAAYEAENYRAGLQSVAHGRWKQPLPEHDPPAGPALCAGAAGVQAGYAGHDQRLYLPAQGFVSGQRDHPDRTDTDLYPPVLCLF